MSGTYTLFGSQGCGSALVLAAFNLTRLPYHYQEVDLDVDSPERQRLLQLNPLGQVPTLLLPNGTVVTESAAILVLLHLRWPLAGLIPTNDSGHLPTFLRWVMVINSQIYPTFTYSDYPQRWVSNSEADALRTSTNAHREALWRLIEDAADRRGPWFFADTFCALDLYIAVMSHWRPGMAWFKQHCPHLAAIAEQVAQHPRLETLFREQFP